MDRAEHIQALQENIDSWEANASALEALLAKSPDDRTLAAKIEGIRAGIARDQGELDQQRGVTPIAAKDQVKDQIRQQVEAKQVRAEAIAELIDEGVPVGILANGASGAVVVKADAPLNPS